MEWVVSAARRGAGRSRPPHWAAAVAAAAAAASAVGCTDRGGSLALAAGGVRSGRVDAHCSEPQPGMQRGGRRRLRATAQFHRRKVVCCCWVSLRPLSARSCVRDASPASAMSFMSETNACGQTLLRLVCRVRGRGAADEEGEGAAHTGHPACVWESGGAAVGLLARRRRGQLGAG